MINATMHVKSLCIAAVVRTAADMGLRFTAALPLADAAACRIVLVAEPQTALETR